LNGEERKTSGERRKIKPGKIVSIVVVVLIVYVCAFSLIAKFVKNESIPMPLGFGAATVLTGSMEPTLRVDDYIIIRKTDPYELAEGDIISFYSEQSDIYGMLVTHRIVGMSDDGRFITRGDANPVDDSITVAPDKIVGRFKRKAQFFIWVNSFTDSRKILLLLVMIPTTLIALYELRTVMKLGRQMNEDHEQEEKERHEKAVRDAIEAEKRRLEEIGYTEDEDDAIKSGIVDEKEND
jgi:signal peptidase I